MKRWVTIVIGFNSSSVTTLAEVETFFCVCTSTVMLNNYFSHPNNESSDAHR